MLEIPELEILRRDLEREINDRKIKEVDLGVVSMVKPLTKKAFVAGLEGMKITGVTRKGVLILVGIQGDHLLVIELGDQTRLTRNQAKDATEPGTALTITFTQGGQLRVVDPKKQAKIELIDSTLDFEDGHHGTLRSVHDRVHASVVAVVPSLNFRRRMIDAGYRTHASAQGGRADVELGGRVGLPVEEVTLAVVGPTFVTFRTTERQNGDGHRKQCQE